MADQPWPQCLKATREGFDPNAQDITGLNWTNMKAQYPEALDGDTFKDNKPYALICPGRHCIEGVNQSPNGHRNCQCKDINGAPVPDCQPKGMLAPYKASVCLNIKTGKYNQYGGRQCMRQGDDWYHLTCFCCCSCFAYDTLIATPSGPQKIQSFQEGSKVLAANVSYENGGVGLKWKPTKISFSQGTASTGIPVPMVFIHHGNSQSIIVSPDHLFLMGSGKLKRADRLVPGKNQFVDEEGNLVPILEVSIGEYDGGIHHIATNQDYTGKLDGHLILSEGIVSGDFNLQIHAGDLKDKELLEDEVQSPVIATPEYEKTNPELATGHYASFKAPSARVTSTEELVNVASVEQPVIAPKPLHAARNFYVHGTRKAFIPESAASYLSKEQALDVSSDAEQANFTDASIHNPAMDHLQRLFGGFYPGIEFFYDVSSLEANAYAFTQYGKKHVVLSGGLVRIKGLTHAGLACIIAHMITRLQASAPLGENNFTSVAMSDYYSWTILQTVFFGNSASHAFTSGVNEIEKVLFKNISRKHSTYTNDPYEPTTETRLDALDAGQSMSYPPAGIGGPTLGGLSPVKAVAEFQAICAKSFRTMDIDENEAEQVFKDLVENGILNDDGKLTDEVNHDTDLSFLFAEKSEVDRNNMTAQVRNVLVHRVAQIQIEFNHIVRENTIGDEDDYFLQPEAIITDVGICNEKPQIVVLLANLKKGIDYTIELDTSIQSQSGSTLDPSVNSIQVILD